MKLQAPFLLIIPLILFSTGCIHFLVGDSSPQKANDLVFEIPSKPFTSLKSDDADHSWQSKDTGNIIAFYSDCSKSSDKPLSLAINEILKGFDRIEEQNQASLFYNNREAMKISLTGYIDGIAVAMESLVFNKNQCFYQISFSGVSNQFQKELVVFEKFKEGFKAP